MTPQQAKKFLKDNNVKFILAQFVDIHGAAKAKAVPVEHLDMVLTDGAGFAGFALWGFGMGPHGPDYMAVGDLDHAARSMPWMPGFARIACVRPRARQAVRLLFARGAQERSSTQLAKKGLTLYTGIEPEFMLLKRARRRQRRRRPTTPTRWRSPATTTRASRAARAFLEQLVDALRRVGIDVYQIDHEDANGQFEVNFTYADALTTADRYICLKMAASEIANQMGMIAHVHAQAVLQPHRHRRALPHLDRRREDQEPVPRRQGQERPGPVEDGLSLPRRAAGARARR